MAARKATAKKAPAKKAKPRKPRGRKPKLLEVVGQDDNGKDITVRDRIIAALRAGAFKTEAAAIADVSEAALYNWIARGEEHRPEEDEDRAAAMKKMDRNTRVYVEFAEAVTRAQATAVVEALTVIKSAARGTKENPGDWRAAAWYLERTRPESYGRKDRMDLGAQGGDGERVTIADLARAVADD